jgi:hypothetical protein
MSWIGPAAKRALKYGPYAAQAWKHLGKPTQAAVQKQASSWAARRTALQHADTVTNGSILGVMENGQRVWVVYSGDESVTAYPRTPTPIEQLVAHADLRRRVTPEQAREAQRMRQLRRRASSRARQIRPRRRRRSGSSPRSLS